MFDFDDDKSEGNKNKQGINFIEAQELWEDVERIVIPAKNLNEPRYLLIARIGNKHWSAIFTIREKKLRIISVRRSRPKEIYLYENG